MRLESSKWIVIENHDAPPGGILRLKAGDSVRFERRPTEWEGWVWCTDQRGTDGWVPERWVSVKGNTCTLLREYMSIELNVRKGDVLSVLEEESGWAWVLDSRNRNGWVPLRCIQRLPAADSADKE